MLLERETLPPVQGRDVSPVEKIDDDCDLAVIAFLQGGHDQAVLNVSIFRCLPCRRGSGMLILDVLL